MPGTIILQEFRQNKNQETSKIMFIPALFKIAHTKPTTRLMNNKMNKLWCIHTASYCTAASLKVWSPKQPCRYHLGTFRKRNS